MFLLSINGMASIFKGRIISGVKEGAYFISMYAGKLEQAVGFRPFPGTLNIELNTTPRYPTRSHFVPSFTRGGKEFGSVFCYPVIMLDHECIAIVPDRSRLPKNVIEIISPLCLRRKFNLKDGDYVEIELSEPKRKEETK